MKLLQKISLVLMLLLAPTPVFAAAKNIPIWPTDQLATVGLGTTQVLTDAATIQVDASLSSSFSVTLGATGRTVTLSNPRDGQTIILYATQDGTGSRTITTWTNSFWAGGTEPTLTTTAGALDIFAGTYNATADKWYWRTLGLDFKQ